MQLRHAQKLNPDNPVLTVALAGVLLHVKQPEEAEQQLRNLLVRHPDHPNGHLLLAYALCDQGKLEEAHKIFERILALDCDPVQRVSAHLGLGALLEKSGDIEGAAKHYQSAVAVDPQIRTILTDIQKSSLRGRPSVPRGSGTMSQNEIQSRMQAIENYLNRQK
jgi:pentatricopeptide repeat protein